MTSLAQPLFKIQTFTFGRAHPRSLGILKSGKVFQGLTLPRIYKKHSCICCTKLTPWEPSPVTFASTDDQNDKFLQTGTNIFDTLDSTKSDEPAINNADAPVKTKFQPDVSFQFLKWPMWILGPSVLLVTGMVPTLWLPISSIFVGSNIASLLSLIGLDCMFNLGATLFLLMADSSARPKSTTEECKSKAPFSYQFWNVVATVTGFFVPLVMIFGSDKGFLQPQLPWISFAILLGPYLLLLSVQILTEALIWHWQSPVWLVAPIIFGSYRVLQLTRGLRLGAEISTPAWMGHTIKGLVCWWVLILGLQIMRVAWFAGVTARARREQSSSATSVAATSE